MAERRWCAQLLFQMLRLPCFIRVTPYSSVAKSEWLFGGIKSIPAASNQGLQYARAEYRVLFNTEVVVTDGQAPFCFRWRGHSRRTS